MDHLPAAVDVVRAVGAAPELRATKDDEGLGTMSGHFSVFDTWYEVDSMWEGKFLERVRPGAFTQTIAEGRDGMRVLFDHGFDPQLGNKVLGPIRSLTEDKIGAHYEVGLFDTSYNRDLLPGLKAGVYGASMRMQVLADSWDDEPKRSDYNPKQLPERSIERTTVAEFGPVTFPASPSASASVRSMTDHYYEQLKARDHQAYDMAVRAASRLPFPNHIGDRSELKKALMGMTRATDATIEELVAAADALVDEVEEALETGDITQATALLTALDETIDSQMVLLGIPDTDEMNPGPQALLSAGPRTFTVNSSNFTVKPTPLILAKRPGARSAGGGSKDEKPGKGATSPDPKAQRFHEMLNISKMGLPKPTTSSPVKDKQHG